MTDREWKLIRMSRDGSSPAESQLFVRTDDPLDQHDRASSEPQVVERLTELLRRWLTTARAGRLPADEGNGGEALDAEELEELRSLGYVQ